MTFMEKIVLLKRWGEEIHMSWVEDMWEVTWVRMGARHTVRQEMIERALDELIFNIPVLQEAIRYPPVRA
jgi:hypothetical protein